MRTFTITIGTLLGSLFLVGCNLAFVPFPRLADPCTSSPKAEVSCAAKRWGDEGALFAAQGIAATRAKDCKDFVLRLAALLPGHRIRVIYTKSGYDDNVGHVSALVQTKEGDFVVDSGFLNIPGDVMAYTDFRTWYGVDYGVFALSDITAADAAAH